MTNEQKIKVVQMKANGKTIKEIADVLSLSVNTVKSYLKRKKNKDTCPCCGLELIHIEHKKKKKFCSDKCRQKYWRDTQKKTATMVQITCKGCGKKFYAHQSKNRKYCSLLCYRGGVVNGK